MAEAIPRDGVSRAKGKGKAKPTETPSTVDTPVDTQETIVVDPTTVSQATLIALIERLENSQREQARAQERRLAALEKRFTSRNRSQTSDTGDSPNANRPRRSREQLSEAPTHGGFKRTKDVKELTDGVDPTYRSWKIALSVKFRNSRSQFSDEQTRMDYLFISTGGDAQQHLETRMESESADPFDSVDDMLAHLDMLFVDSNEVSESKVAYHELMMKESETFATFRTRFLQLASKGNVPKEDWKNDLFRKLTVSLQTSLMPVKATLDSFQELSDRAHGVYQDQAHLQKRLARRSKRRAFPEAESDSSPTTTNRSSSGKLPVTAATSGSLLRGTTPTTQPRKSQTPAPASEEVCYNCNKPGHYASSYPLPRRPTPVKTLEAVSEEKVTVEFVSDSENQGNESL